MERYVEIGGRRIGEGYPAYLIAEMSANHGHDLGRAMQLLKAAKEAGADAIKLQTYTADTMTIACDNEHFRIKGTLWDGRTLHDLYQEACTPWEWHAPLQAEARRLGLDFFSTPFDDTALEFLETLDVPAYKIASFENADLPLLQRIARTGKPVILSTGMASLGEMDEAVRVLRAGGTRGLVLLKCTSAYPAPPEAMNLRTIPHLAEAFAVPAGLSDHTLGSEVAVAAVVLGACVIEKHFCLRRADGGPDSAFSMEPAEFSALAAAVRRVEKALGRVEYTMDAAERSSTTFRRSIFAVRDIRAGDAFTEENIRIIRPGYGLAPKRWPEVLQRTAACDIARGTPLAWNLVGGPA